MNVDTHIEAIVEATGIDPNLVRTVTIDHSTITVESFATDDQGHKFIRGDGNVATETSTFPHRAFKAVPAG